MALSLTDLAGVVGPGDRIPQSGEGRQEHSALELLITAPGRQLASDRRTRTSRDGRQSRVSGEMSRRREGAARDIDQESNCFSPSEARCAGDGYRSSRSSMAG
jgi:hypothetical protein